LSELWLSLAVAVAGAVAGGVASVAGFGIGSLLTPLLVTHVTTKVAVAAVAIPHVIGTAARLWLLRGEVDRHLLVRFGLTSAAGGLAGALLQGQTTSAGLTIVFGVLLLFVAASELTGLSKRMRFRGPAAWIAGALSGLLGGLVGNQGGIRTPAGVSRHAGPPATRDVAADRAGNRRRRVRHAVRSPAPDSYTRGEVSADRRRASCDPWRDDADRRPVATVIETSGPGPFYRHLPLPPTMT
jgi:hypothetical protein